MSSNDRQCLAEIAGLLRSHGPLLLAANLNCTVGEPLSPRSGKDIGTYRRFPSPTFVFDPARSKTDSYLNRGLEEHGPFDAESFTAKRPVVVVVTPKDYQGDLEVFLRHF